MWNKCEDAIVAIEQRKHHHSGLEQLKKAMKELNDPQDDLTSIHIGGTNGKGSSVNYIRSILNEAGYKVGTFTSPYLVSHHDRIRIDNVNISDEKLLSYLNSSEEIWKKYDLSMFEIDMLVASLYFKDEKVDFAIFEVGMGGRLDATNILKKPIVTAITNIGLDHMEYLGNTYEAIAKEKAAIIKEGVNCITGSKRKDCIQVFKNTCKEHHCSCICVGECTDIKIENGVSFVYQNQDYQLSTLATYQCKNAALAIEVVNELKRQNVAISIKNIERGLHDTEWPGRFEIVKQDPLVIIDGAHNADGMTELIESIKPFHHIHVIFSCLKDKDGANMLEKLLKISDDITICEFDFYRAQKAEAWENYPVKIEKDYVKAIQDGMKKKGVLLICGSLYFISLVRKYFKQ